jgi:hypothetical protein
MTTQWSGGSGDPGENDRNVHDRVKSRHAGKASGERIPMPSNHGGPSIATTTKRQRSGNGDRRARSVLVPAREGVLTNHPQRGGKGTCQGGLQEEGGDLHGRTRSGA